MNATSARAGTGDLAAAVADAASDPQALTAALADAARDTGSPAQDRRLTVLLGITAPWGH